MRILLFIHVTMQEDVTLVVEKLQSDYMLQYCITNSTNAVALIHNEGNCMFIYLKYF